MKRLLLLPLLSVLFFFSCKNKKTGILNPSNLTSSFITIDAGKDNTLKTPKGAIIKIAANSFNVPAGAKVNIEIKEAYNMQDILKAGLTTMSNGKPLQSGGMIYFNAVADGKPVDFLKPVGITTPSSIYNDSMKVFKGEIRDDSNINWIEPKQLDTSDFFRELSMGRDLFKANCASCHHPYEDKTGPALAGSRERAPNKEWAYKFTNNVNTMIVNDPYAKLLLAKWKSLMTQFNLPKQDIKAILDYCDNEAALYKPQLLENTMPSMPGVTYPDSLEKDPVQMIDCGYDTLPVYEETVIENIEEDITDIDSTVSINYIPAPVRPSYSFSIDKSGWYNIDCFIDNNIDLVSDVVLTALVKNAEDKVLDVYLCMPSKKLLTSGYEDDGKFIFNNEGGKIKLIKGEEAFVYVLALKENMLYYGISNFVVKDEQHLVIDLKESSKEEIMDELRKNKVGNTEIDKSKPVIEKFIEVVPSNSTTDKTDSVPLIKEMQIIKKNCEASDSSKSIPFAFNDK